MRELKSVLMTADAVGGVFNYSLQLARELCQKGVEVTLVILGPEPSMAQRRQLSELRGLRVFEHHGALEWMDDPWSDVAAAGELLLRLSRTLCPDVVHLNGFSHGALDFQAPKVVVAHSCVLSWWEAVERSPAPARLEPYRSAVRRGLHAADLVIAPSRDMHRCLERHYGALATSRVIHNGVTPHRPSGIVKRPLILCAGRLWDRAKNVDTLARAAQGLPWKVAIAGEIDAPFPNVEHLGQLSQRELAQCYERASIYASPARYEPFGLAVLEAALAGSALVLGEIASLQEIWGDAAVYVDPDDSRAWHRELGGLIAAPARRAELGRRARARAEQLSASSMSERYLSAYRTLLSSNAALAATVA